MNNREEKKKTLLFCFPLKSKLKRTNITYKPKSQYTNHNMSQKWKLICSLLFRFSTHTIPNYNEPNGNMDMIHYTLCINSISHPLRKKFVENLKETKPKGKQQRKNLKKPKKSNFSFKYFRFFGISSLENAKISLQKLIQSQTHADYLLHTTITTTTLLTAVNFMYIYSRDMVKHFSL